MRKWLRWKCRVPVGTRTNGGRTGRLVDNRAKRREQRRNGTR